jgi:uncharacterized Zn finger protein
MTGGAAGPILNGTSRARRGARGSSLHAAVIACELCGRETSHRVLHVEPGASPTRLTGVARCQECRSIHRFDIATPRNVELRLVISEGPTSRVVRHPIAVGEPLRVGGTLRREELELQIHRIEVSGGGAVPSARAELVKTLWATVDHGAVVPVSIVEGRRTIPYRLTLPPDEPLTVGRRLEVQGESYTIAGLRARQRTWRVSGDSFPAREVARVYARRIWSPPEGSSGWSSPRESPSSRASSVSAAARSRSSPGPTMARRVPRARSASGGAAHQSSSDS